MAGAVDCVVEAVVLRVVVAVERVVVVVERVVVLVDVRRLVLAVLAVDAAVELLI